MSNLFENKSMDLNNFGLDNHVYLSTIEVQNWGPFSGFWEIPLKTLPALVVGENGTGKSSLLDAILTVLVENGLQYNNAVDNKGRIQGKRKLEEYVRGFKESSKDGNLYKNTVYLREKGEISFVLLRFASYSHTYSVGQIFAINESDTASKKYVYKDGYLTARDFPKNATSLEEYCNIISKFDDVVANGDRKKYFNFVREKLALDTNAMQLLNTLSSRKNIDNVNTMIRSYMFLDKSDFIDDFKSLRIELDNINVFINKLKELKGRNDMLGKLVPLIEKGRKLQQQVKLLKDCKDKVVPYLYRCAESIGQKELETLKDKLNTLDKVKENLNKQIKEAVISQTTLEVARDNIGGINIANLERDISALETSKNDKLFLLSEYSELLKKLGLSIDFSNESSFLKGQNNIKNEEDALDVQLHGITDTINKYSAEDLELGKQLNSLESQKRELERNKISLNPNLIALRDELCKIAGVPVNDMPFLGEYLSVNDKEWIPALEYLYHDASLSFLVPVKFEKLVASHIEDLKKKYHTGANYAVMKTVNYAETDGGVAWEKISVRQDLKYVSWVEEYVKRIGFPYCCNTVEEFVKKHPAIMKNGLRSFDTIRHKLNGRKLDDVHNYVMSGSYQQLLDALTIDIETVKKQKADVVKQIVVNKNKLDSLKTKKELFKQVPFVRNFSAIDVSNLDVQINEKKDRLSMLKQSKDFKDIDKNIAKIKDKIKKVEDGLKKNEDNKEKTLKEFSVLEDNLMNYKGKLLTTSFSDEEEKMLKVEFDKRKPNSSNPSFKTIMDMKVNIESHFYKQISKENETCLSTCHLAESFMEDYVKVYKSRINDLHPSMNENTKDAEKFIEEYNQIHDNYLEKDIELSKKIGEIGKNTAIGSFIIGLTHNVDETIKDIIQNINKTLSHVPYSNDKNPTFLEVGCVQTKSSAIVELRKRLNEIAGLLNNKEKLEEMTLRMNDLISFISEFNVKSSNKYNKDNILDIRNWFEFPVAECRWNDTKTELYHVKELDEIGKQSGGEGVKLAYFIMAACYSMWMHFNDSGYNKNVFGFLMIDEIDDKISPTNLHDVIMLFYILGIQLVSMLPISDKVSQYENFVGNIVCTGFLQKPESYLETISYADYVNRNKKLIDERIKRGRQVYEQNKVS